MSDITISPNVAKAATVAGLLLLSASFTAGSCHERGSEQDRIAKEITAQRVNCDRSADRSEGDFLALLVGGYFAGEYETGRADLNTLRNQLQNKYIFEGIINNLCAPDAAQTRNNTLVAISEHMRDLNSVLHNQNQALDANVPKLKEAGYPTFTAATLSPDFGAKPLVDERNSILNRCGILHNFMDTLASFDTNRDTNKAIIIQSKLGFYLGQYCEAIK